VCEEEGEIDKNYKCASFFLLELLFCSLIVLFYFLRSGFMIFICVLNTFFKCLMISGMIFIFMYVRV